MSGEVHNALVLRAEKWLNSIGCGVVIRDPFRCSNAENPDAIGWRSGVSILVECKASRADFLADRKKRFRQFPLLGMGGWRFYMCPPDLIKPDEMPNGWGLLYAGKYNVKRIVGVPKGNVHWGSPPNKSSLIAENIILLSALRRLTIRGHLPEIYEGIPKPEPALDGDGLRKQPKRPIAEAAADSPDGRARLAEEREGEA